MKINFNDKKVKDLCEKKNLAVRKLGALCASKLRARLSDLEAVDRVTDLVVGNPHPLKGDRAGQFALDLAGGYRLVFVPDNDPCPKGEDGAIDWSKVTIVAIEYIGDYHD